MGFLDSADTVSGLSIVHAGTGAILATSVEIARTSAARRKGLLGRDGLASGSALVISRCNAIHTVGMRFAIDVAFVDADGVVRRIVRGMPPRRIAISPSARIAIEWAAGELQPSTVNSGDRIYLTPASTNERRTHLSDGGLS